MTTLQKTSITHTLVVRLSSGEDILESLEKIVLEHDIKGGQLSLIGAISSATLGYFDMESKEYKSVTLDENLEVTSCIGNISRLEDGTPVVHAHMVVSNEYGSSFSGHLMKGCKVSATIEVILHVFEGQLTRAKDGATGLNLLKLQ